MGGPVGLGPVAMSGAFDVPLGHLAFDHPRFGPVSSGRVEPPAEQHDGVTPAAVTGLRGENRAPLRCCGERCAERRRSGPWGTSEPKVTLSRCRRPEDRAGLASAGMAA